MLRDARCWEHFPDAAKHKAITLCEALGITKECRGQLRVSTSPYSVVEGADALVLVTEWKQFRQPDFARIRGLMRMPVLFDGCNIYDAQHLAELGFLYRGIGRPALGHCKASAA